MRVRMQKLNMVKYACTKADVERLEKKGFKAAAPAVPEETGQSGPSGQEEPDAPPGDPEEGTPAEGQPTEPEKKPGRAGKRKSGEKDGSDD